eukprot:TRINITY_DN6650_c2_g2_i1.p1 TRINITY_DN6650_c2_g2~~TRINITY_DN6650_c2_g2_i1.p1  ORF type:complete len:351 (-),score=78.52 TRINITY_DN6650_c2_g2_i1:183-1235(-)
MGVYEVFPNPCFFLVLSYFSIILLVIIQFIRSIKYKNRLASFHTGFIFLCFLWSLLRAFFFLFFDKLTTPESNFDNVAFILLYWFPFILQFATFALLVVFFAHIIHKHEWKRLKFIAWLIYMLSNAFFIILFTIFVIFIFIEQDKSWPALSLQILAGVVALILMITLAVYGTLLTIKIRNGSSTSMIRNGDSPISTILVTTFIFLAYASRTIFDFVTLIDGRGLILETPCTFTHGDTVTLICYICWEITPILLVLIFFGFIPTRNTKAKLDRGLIINYPANYQTVAETNNIFSNPSRYDSMSEKESEEDQIFENTNHLDSNIEQVEINNESEFQYSPYATSTTSNPNSYK